MAHYFVDKTRSNSSFLSTSVSLPRKALIIGSIPTSAPLLDDLCPQGIDNHNQDLVGSRLYVGNQREI